MKIFKIGYGFSIIKFNNHFKMLFFLKVFPICIKSSISPWETNLCKLFYKDFLAMERKTVKKRLLSNLDLESKFLVNKILKRIKIANSRNFSFNFFENLFITYKKEFFESQIKEINSNAFQYKNYILPINHFEMSVFHYKHSIDKIKNLGEIKNKDIIDVGGFIGDSAIVLSDYTNKNVYTFEPVNENYSNILKTISLNNVTNIKPVKLGLGSKEETLLIQENGATSNINRFKEENAKLEEIQIASLDEYLQQHPEINVGLIKVDIEGFEPEFLKGAINTIKKFKPTMLLSIYHNANDFFNIKPFIEDLNLGYKFKITKPLDGSIRGEILLICECN